MILYLLLQPKIFIEIYLLHALHLLMRSSINSNSSSHILSSIPEDALLSDNSSNNNNARIKVAIRVRPLTSKEIKLNAKVILQNISDNTTNNNQFKGDSLAVWDPAALQISQSLDKSSTINPACWTKQFHFDKIFWSLDPTDGQNYDSQNDIYEQLGKPVVDWIISGYNCSVLAYGQTGGGKL